MEITIKIKLGNDAMQTPADVLQAIDGTLARFYWERYEPLTAANVCPIMDSFGNTVGTFEVA